MMMTTSIITALTMGLLGAGHCIGMCGGIAAAISFGTPSQSTTFPYVLCYNLGRLASYGVFGALAGGMIALVSDHEKLLLMLRLASGIMMVLLALYIGQFWNGLAFLERGGQKIWRFISPLTKKLLPLTSPFAALPFGFVWGWLPCGMVYSALSWAALSGSSAQGFALMIAFGIGTLPAMLLAGGAAQSLKKFVNNRIVRRISALILLAYGLLTIWSFLMRANMQM